MDAIRNWAYSIAALVVFGTLTELIMPGNTYRKYIHLTMGFLLILSLLSPFSGLWDKGFDIDGFVDYYGGVAEYSGVNREAAEDKQKEDVIKIYKETLENNIKVRLESKLNITVTRVEVAAAEGGEEFGNLEGVTVVTESDRAAEITEAVAAVTGLAAKDIAIRRE